MSEETSHAQPDYKALYEKAVQQYNELAELMAKQPGKEKAPQSANCEAPGWISSDHARRNDCTIEQPEQQIDWRMVPVELTPEMMGVLQWFERGSPTQIAYGWRRVLDAATQPAQQQEPVALPEKMYEFVPTPEPIKWHHPECEGQCIACLIEQVVQEAYGSQGLGYLQRHLTSPPASKPWVGLTQQDIDIAFDDTQEGGGFNEFARAIEAKLREKNT